MVSLSRRKILRRQVGYKGKSEHWGAWVAQLVKLPTSAQVMISQFLSLGPTLDSVLTAWRLEPVSDSVSPSLSNPPPFSLSLSLSLLKLNNKH